MSNEITGHFALVYPSKYIKAADLMGRDVTVTILEVRAEMIEMEGGRKDKKAVLYIADAKGKPIQKTWVAGKTVLKQIGAALNEPIVGAWKGKRVTMYPTTCKSKGGETVECVRVRVRTSTKANEMPEDMLAPSGEHEQPAPAADSPAPPAIGEAAKSILDALTAAKTPAEVDAACKDFDAACKARQIKRSEGEQIRLLIAARREALTETTNTETTEEEQA